MMHKLLFAFFLFAAAPAWAGTAEEVLAAYRGFADAQNARDADRIRAQLTGGDAFLWVSDGKAFWGAETAVARMSSFQRAEIWRVEPDLEAARVVEIGEGVALLHMPLMLVIGSAARPDHLNFLVSILFAKRDAAWRISALLTTTAKP